MHSAMLACEKIVLSSNVSFLSSVHVHVVLVELKDEAASKRVFDYANRDTSEI